MQCRRCRRKCFGAPHPDAPFYLDFQFTDGSGTGDSNNTVTISDFSVSGVGAANLTNGGSGDLGSSITLIDSSFFNEVYQQFSPTNSLQFQLSLTTNVDAGGTPDEFTFAILYGSSLFEIPTISPNGAFLTVDITNPLTINSSASDPSQPLGTDPGVNIPAPSIDMNGTQVPEPATLGLGCTGLGMLMLVRRRSPLSRFFGREPKPARSRFVTR